jgi:hypothetical protein
MAGSDTEKRLVLEVGLDHSGVQKGLQAVSRQSKKFWTDVGKQAGKYSRVVKDVAKPALYSKMGQGVKKVASEYKRLDQEMGNFNAHINKLYSDMTGASADRVKDIKKEIAEYKRLQTAHMKAEDPNKGKGGARVGARKAVGAVKNAAKDSSGKEVKEAAGGAIIAGFAAGSALLRKDFQGMFEEGAKAVGKGWTAAFAGSGKVLGNLGKFLQKKGSTLQATGAAKGGHTPGGAAMGALGGAMKGLGGISKAVGPLLNVVSKLGPLLSGAAGIVMKIVTLFMDVESKAKEMNKQILQVSGTSGFLYKNMGDTDKAMADMGATLAHIRKDATSMDNLKWGINKEDHMAMISTLAAEGVRIEELEKQFDAVGDSADAASLQAKSFGGAVHVAVAYSHQFGVSIAELAQFQAEMMTELGSGVADVQPAFHMLSQAAAESGIASNKFFSIIRGVSADLTLYNGRLEETAHILSLVGKAMSPRNAAKFMQTASTALKGMGRVERFKTNMLGGGGMGALVTKDLQRKSGTLADKITSAGGKASKEDILNPAKDIADLLKGVPDQMQGEFKEAINSMRVDQNMNKKGAFGAAMAGKNLGPGAALQALKDSLKITGGGKLKDRRGDQALEMLAESRGFNEDQLDHMTQFEMAIDEQRETLKKQLKKGGKEAVAATESLKKAGIDASQIDSASYDDIVETLSKSRQDEIKGSVKEINYAQQTAEYTSTVSDKLEVLGDFVMNELYESMSGMLEILGKMILSPLFGEAVSASVKALPTILGGPLVLIADLLSDIVKSVDAVFHTNFGKGIDDGIKKMGEGLERAMGTIPAKDAEGSEKEAFVPKTMKQRLDEKAAGAKAAKEQDAAKAAAESAEADRVKAAADQVGGGGHKAVTSSATGKIREMTGFNRDEATATPPPGQSPAAAAAAAKADKVDPVTSKQGDDTLSALDSIQSVLFTKGIKINKTFLKDVFWTNGHDSVLEATREALFEYFMYSNMDRGSVAQGLKDGAFTASTFGKKAGSYTKDTGTPPMLSEQLKGYASGGVIPQPKSPDSVFVAARPGETILPKGAGQGGQANLTIPISVNGPGGQELANMMRSAAIDVVQQWQRKQKYT